MNELIESDQIEEVGSGGRLEGVAGDVGAERLKNEGEPRALEPGVTGDEDLFAFPKIFMQSHINFLREKFFQLQSFQGARPAFHIVSRLRLSRIVSMHCQKPSCL